MARRDWCARAELRAQFKRLLLQKQWPELLDRIEAAFAEGANHFWLDLQYYAFIAQEQAGGEYAQAREQVATDCALMLERLPGLEQLGFSEAPRLPTMQRWSGSPAI